MNKDLLDARFDSKQLDCLVNLFKWVSTHKGSMVDPFLSINSFNKGYTTIIVKQGDICSKMTFVGNTKSISEHIFKASMDEGIAYKLLDFRDLDRLIKLTDNVKNMFSVDGVDLTDLKSSCELWQGLGCVYGLLRIEKGKLMLHGATSDKHDCRSVDLMKIKKDSYSKTDTDSGWFKLVDIIALTTYLKHVGFTDLSLWWFNNEGRSYIVLEHGFFNGLITATH